MRHAHDRVVNRRITVRMIFTDHIANDTRGFLVGLVVIVGKFMHCVEHAAMHRLQAVANIRQRATNDDTQGILEEALTHLGFNTDGNGLFCELR